MPVKNKHGRKGVKKYVPNRPLAEDQKAEIKEKAHAQGFARGERSMGLKALELVNASRTIRDARRRIEELVNAQA